MMTPASHPDEATLFDLIEGALPEARAREIEAHLDACADCGALVTAALAGSPDDVTPVTAMPSEAVAKMDAALASAWRDRTAAIAAAEVATDADRVDTLTQTPLIPTAMDLGTSGEQGVAEPASRSRARGRRGRRLVPILAFCVLGALAGTSIWVGTQPGSGGDTRSASDEAATSVTAKDSSVSGGATAEEFAQREVQPLPSTPETSAVTPEEDMGAGSDAADGFAPPPTEQKQEQWLCIATLDETQLYLPDGRVPREVLTGPLGLYLVCG